MRRNGSGNGNGAVKDFILQEALIASRDSSAEKAILATLYEAIKKQNPKLLEEYLSLLEKYDLKSTDLSEDASREALRLLKKFLLTKDRHLWNEISFRDFLVRQEPKEDLLSYLEDLLLENHSLHSPLVFEEAVRLVKEESLKARMLLKALPLLSDRKRGLHELLQAVENLTQELKEEIGKIGKTEEAKKIEEVEKLFLTPEELENVRVDWLVADFIPKNAITGITAKFSTGKTTLVYAILKTFVLKNGYRVLYVDLDNPLTVIKKKLEDFGLKEYVEIGQLKILSRHKTGLNARHEAWQKVKEWLLSQEEHYVVVFDSLKNFARGYDINSDKEAEFLMAELKDLTSKHTVIYLHHIPKLLNPDMPFKNSGTILDNTDVAFFLETDKQTRIFKLTRFKDRIPVRDRLEFYLGEDGTLEKALPEWAREAIKFVKAVFEEVEKGNKKKVKLAKVVSEKTRIGVKRCEALLEHYAGRYWEIKQGEHNAKIIEPVKDLEEVIKELENKAYAKSIENQEFDGHQTNETKEAPENQEFDSLTDIYNIEVSNCRAESNTLKFEEEIKAIQGVLKELLEYGDYVDLGSVKVYSSHEDNAREIAKDPTLKGILLELYVAHESGSVQGWDHLIEEVREGRKPFHQALKEFLDLGEIDF